MKAGDFVKIMGNKRGVVVKIVPTIGTNMVLVQTLTDSRWYREQDLQPVIIGAARRITNVDKRRKEVREAIKRAGLPIGGECDPDDAQCEASEPTHTRIPKIRFSSDPWDLGPSTMPTPPPPAPTQDPSSLPNEGRTITDFNEQADAPMGQSTIAQDADDGIECIDNEDYGGAREALVDIRDKAAKKGV